MKILEAVIIVMSIVALAVAALTHSVSFAIIGACGFILCAGHAPALPYERPSRK